MFSSKAAELFFICITLSCPTYPSPPGIQLQVPLSLPPVHTGLVGLLRGNEAEGMDSLQVNPWPCIPLGGTRQGSPPHARAARWDSAHPTTSQAVCHPPTPFSAMSCTSWPGFMLHPWYLHVGVTNVVCLWSECRTWAGLAARGKLHRCVLPAASSACTALYLKRKHFDLDVKRMKVKANNGSL